MQNMSLDCSNQIMLPTSAMKCSVIIHTLALVGPYVAYLLDGDCSAVEMDLYMTPCLTPV